MCLQKKEQTNSMLLNQSGDGEETRKNPLASSSMVRARPFVKWAGGKNQLFRALSARSPPNFRTYYESFLGGGAFFFGLCNIHASFKAVLSDTNEELVTAYQTVRNNIDDLIQSLIGHQKNYYLSPKKYYYAVRDFQNPRNNIERTSRFLFLNRTCYNGLYRVNRNGKFNVPFGAYKRPKICDEKNLRSVSAVLRSSLVEVKEATYEEAASTAGEDDFLYFDPPYQPCSSTANFTAYTSIGFTIEDQVRLASFFRELDRKRCKIMMSNSDVLEIQRLYSEFCVETVPSLRAINCLGGRRKGHSELIIRNYSIGID